MRTAPPRHTAARRRHLSRPVSANSGGKSALVMRLHHTVGDGISIVSVMNRVLKDRSGAPLAMQVPFQRKDGAGKGMNMGMMGKILAALGTCLYIGVR